jgi:CRISPR/Cas system-associated exonuclease Cas4 (RecB family)
MPMPGVFAAISTRIQGSLIGKNLKSLSKDLPEGVVESQEGWVDSKVIPGTDVYIKGKYDLLVKRPNGSYLLIDLKISQPGQNKVDKYKTQLNAYRYAITNPKYGKPFNITKMGLMVFYPDKVEYQNNSAILTFPPKWMEVQTDERGFIRFAKKINKLLAGKPPEEGKNCKWCQYRHLGEKMSHLNENTPEINELPF